MSPASNTSVVSIDLPVQIYDELMSLQTTISETPVEIIRQLVYEALEHRLWLYDLSILREQIRHDGGLKIGSSDEDILIKMRQTRNKVFEEEYADLY